MFAAGSKRGRAACAALLTALALARCASGPDPARALIDELLETHASGTLDDAARLRVAEAILDAEMEFGVPALLMLAVIERESRFDPRAVGPQGARGLMQVRPATARSTAKLLEVALEDVEELFHEPTNIRLGSAYLARMHERFGDWHLALTAFNMGPTRLRRLQARRPTSSSPYSRRIMQRYEAWQSSLDLDPDAPPGS